MMLGHINGCFNGTLLSDVWYCIMWIKVKCLENVIALGDYLIGLLWDEIAIAQALEITKVMDNEEIRDLNKNIEWSYLPVKHGSFLH